MLKLKRLRPRPRNRIVFFQEFLKHPKQVGSIVPSSRFLERRVVEVAAVRSAETIVELGSGTGGTTRAILRAMRQHTRLLCIEVNPLFHASLDRIDDPRLVAHNGGANDLVETLSLYGLDAPDAVISGIPFSKMSRAAASRILAEISSVLAPGGRFVAYQFHNRVQSLCRPFFGPGQTEVEFLNIPPTRVYSWEKQAG